jgi:tRNA dimethylallyltransferase
VDRTAPLIVITGPTGSGKTGIALDLARRFPIEAVSADSMQVYRHMDIATAKPTAAEQALLPHHLIDIRDPDEEFNAGMFMAMAAEKIGEIRARRRIPVVVGGTGLYIKALIYGLAPVPPRSSRLRDWLRSLAQARGTPHLWEALNRMDPKNAEHIRKNDAVRIARSLEIIFLTGRRASEVLGGHGFSEAWYRARIICVMPGRDLLYRSIDERVHAMVEAGLLEETWRLLELGYDPSLRSMQTLAYKHVLQLLEGRIGLPSCVGRIQRDTRHYAKRQITWMRSHYDQGSFLEPERARAELERWLQEEASPAIEG